VESSVWFPGIFFMGATLMPTEPQGNPDHRCGRLVRDMTNQNNYKLVFESECSEAKKYLCQIPMA